MVLRLSLAPAISWWLSMQIFGHSQAFYAPIAAILTLTIGVGKRAAVLVEIILGAALGVLVAELLILLIGRGPWQLIVVVALAVVSASFLRMSGMALTQAVIGGVLLVAIVPLPGGADPALTRFVDAIVGGTVGLAMIILIPSNPIRDLDRAYDQLRGELVAILEEIAAAMCIGDLDRAAEALEHARGTQPMVESVGATAGSLSEMARLSPFRWRQRDSVNERIDALRDLDHALRNTRVLARRVAAMLRRGEQVPAGLAGALDELTRIIRTDGQNTEALLGVARDAVAAASSNLTLNTAAIASQVRAIVADMLLAAGVEFAVLDALLDFD